MDSELRNRIFNSFLVATKKKWLEAAKHELEGADPIQKLGFKKGNLTCLPYYDQGDLGTNEHFQLPPSANEFLGARAWYNMPTVDVSNESESNRIALSDLNSGADGIVFNFKTAPDHISTLLEKIEWPYCSISFEGALANRSLEQIHTYALEKKYDVTTLTGCVFSNTSFENESESLKQFEDWKTFHPLGITIEKKESPDEEIATALAQAVKQIDWLTDEGLSVKQALQAHAFKVQIDEDFFLTIAKLKALRQLWNNVATTFNATGHTPIFIHTCSPVWNEKAFMPHGNMLKSTTAALSAILGGCDALSLFPEKNESTMMARIALNVSSILREESHLSKVADPTAGSYYLETLTDQLATKAWKKFQKMV